MKMKSFHVLALLSTTIPSSAQPWCTYDETTLRSQSNTNNSTGHSWMGTNLYYLQGLSESDQDAYIDAMSQDGAKVIRLWVNKQTAGECQKGSLINKTVPDLETTIGKYNDSTLDVLDSVLVKLSKNGIKALISPHDGNSLLGDYRADAYWGRWGASYFYEEQDAFDAYDARLSHILNYKGTTSGRVWKDWTEAIMGFDLQNEPMVAKTSECTNRDVHDWVCGRAMHMRDELGADNPIKVVSGGIGGDYSHGCTFLSTAVQCDALDVIAIHRYASVPGYWASNSESWVSQANGKLVFVEEWGINAASYNQSSAFPSETADFNSVGLPNLYWEIILPDVQQCKYHAVTDTGDQFGIVYNSGVNISGAMHEASKSDALQDWRSIK